MMRSDCSGEVVAVVFVCYDTGKTGHVDMLSVIPEYMGLGLSSGLLRNSEYLLHEAGKSEMTMKVFLSRDSQLTTLRNWATPLCAWIRGGR